MILAHRPGFSVRYAPVPIPCPEYDWIATRADSDPESDAIGYGSDPDSAVAALLDSEAAYDALPSRLR